MTIRNYGLVFLFLSTSFALADGVTHDQENLTYWLKTMKSHPLELVRKNAAKMLGSIADKRTLNVLIEGLKDPAPSVRQEVSTSLGNMVDPRAIPALEDVADRDPDPEVRKRAKNALGKIQKRKEFDKAKRGDDSV